MEETLLRKRLALPIFASDALSSVAYATEAALVVLVAASLASRDVVFPVSLAIAALLAIVVLSYTQVVSAYSTSGGAYVVARDNLGTLPSLLAGAALLTDYVLTVAVSVAAGVLALTSAAPGLAGSRVWLALACIALVALVNLRGVREAGIAFAVPTYGFIIALYATIGTGLVKCAAGACPQASVPDPLAAGAGTAGLFVILRAFAAGSSALTGVEAIANGVNAFRHPQSRNAAQTLIAMGAIALTLFLGVSYLAVQMDARPSGTVSVLSEIARATFPDSFPSGAMFYLVQAFSLAILVVAANTAFQGFPRLAAVMAREGFFPRQFGNLGDRLVFSNGVIVLATVAGLLIVAFRAEVNHLIHLYLLGVFTAFTLSQTGMVRYWQRERTRGWRRRATVNGVGAAATGVVAVIVAVTKFTGGAWIVVAAIPVIIALLLLIHRHYRAADRRLRAGARAVLARGRPRNTVLLFVESLDAAAAEALWYARTISDGSFRAILAPSRGSADELRERFADWAGEQPDLEILRSDSEPVDAVLDQISSLPRGKGDFVTVVVPELFRRPSLLAALFRRTFALKHHLPSEPGVVITDVPRLAQEAAADPLVPGRAVCVVPISGVHGASVRAASYAQTLGLSDAHALFFAFDAKEAEEVRRDWKQHRMELPLEVVEGPQRDLGIPLLAHLRQTTVDRDTVAVVVMPELVARGWHRLLHNPHELYLKRLLIFEPRVILATIPYRLD